MTTAWDKLEVEVSRSFDAERTTVRCTLRERLGAATTERLELVTFSRGGGTSSHTAGTWVSRPRERFFGLAAALTPESRSRLARWWAPDPETGDRGFDDEVLLSTQEPQATLEFLAKAEVRADLRALLALGARLTFAQRTVTAELPGRVTDDPPALRRLVEAYGNFARGLADAAAAGSGNQPGTG